MEVSLFGQKDIMFLQGW